MAAGGPPGPPAQGGGTEGGCGMVAASWVLALQQRERSGAARCCAARLCKGRDVTRTNEHISEQNQRPEQHAAGWAARPGPPPEATALPAPAALQCRPPSLLAGWCSARAAPGAAAAAPAARRAGCRAGGRSGCGPPGAACAGEGVGCGRGGWVGCVWVCVGGGGAAGNFTVLTPIHPPPPPTPTPPT